MREDLLILDLWIALVAQPVIFIGNRHAVHGIAVRALFGDRGLDGGFGLGGHAVFLCIVCQRWCGADAKGDRGSKFQEQFHKGDVLTIWGGQLDSGSSHVHL